MNDRLILVAGSGRSGTSLFSGILKALGCHVPQPEVEADNTNPRGFGEPQWVVDFHTELLLKARVQTADARPIAWADAAKVSLDRGVEKTLQGWLGREFNNGDHVVIKDPRILWFLPLWTTVGEHIGAGVRYATVLRHPREVIGSKITHYGDQFNPTNRTAGWINTMLYTERATREGMRTFTRYEDLLSDWTVEIAKIGTGLDLPILNDVPSSHIRVASQLVDPSLRRTQTDWDTLGVHRQVADMAEETWDVFDRLATKDDVDDASIQRELDELRDRYVEFYDLVEATAYSSVLAARREERAVASRGAVTARSIAGRMKRRVRRRLRSLKHRLRNNSTTS